MIAASVLGLPAIFLLITVLPCIRMGHEPGAAKYRRSQLGGILIILLGKARRGLLRFGMVRCVSREGKIYGQWVLLLWDISEEAAGPRGGEQSPVPPASLVLGISSRPRGPRRRLFCAAQPVKLIVPNMAPACS